MNRWRIRLAADVLTAGGLVAYPTEAVFGIGCDPNNLSAVRSLFQLKQRPLGQGVILIAACFEQIVPYVGAVSDRLRSELMATWPGPVTWIMPAATATPGWICGPNATVAVRVTSHVLSAALCNQFGGAIVSTSANLRGRPAARRARQIKFSSWHSKIDFILSGPTDGQAGPSEIRDAAHGKVLRHATSKAAPTT